MIKSSLNKSGRRDSNPRPSHFQPCGQRWIRTTEVIRQQIYSLPHLATLEFALHNL